MFGLQFTPQYRSHWPILGLFGAKSINKSIWGIGRFISSHRQSFHHILKHSYGRHFGLTLTLLTGQPERGSPYIYIQMSFSYYFQDISHIFEDKQQICCLFKSISSWRWAETFRFDGIWQGRLTLTLLTERGCPYIYFQMTFSYYFQVSVIFLEVCH